MKCPRCRSYFTLSPLIGPPGRNRAIVVAEPAPVLATARQAEAAAPPATEVDLQAAEDPVSDESVPEAGSDEVVDSAIEQSALPVSRPKKPVNQFGVASFLFGSLAILALSFPFASGWIVPLSSLGVLCGV